MLPRNGVELLLGHSLLKLEHADDVVLPASNDHAAQLPNDLTTEVIRYDIRFAMSNCSVILRLARDRTRTVLGQ